MKQYNNRYNIFFNNDMVRSKFFFSLSLFFLFFAWQLFHEMVQAIYIQREILNTPFISLQLMGNLIEMMETKRSINPTPCGC